MKDAPDILMELNREIEQAIFSLDGHDLGILGSILVRKGLLITGAVYGAQAIEPLSNETAADIKQRLS